MLKRTIEKTVNTPAYARITARWALRSAATTPTGSYYPLITAKIFTAFMFEGAIDYLGETLCPTWNTSSSRPNRAPAWQSLAERHKAVRRLLNLDNGNREYDDIRAIVDRLFRFRDSFAHPKVLEQTIQDSVPNAMAAAPEIAWEAEVDATLVQSDFNTLEAYSGRAARHGCGLPGKRAGTRMGSVAAEVSSPYRSTPRSRVSPRHPSFAIVFLS
jgi:hypothetical protein